MVVYGGSALRVFGAFLGPVEAYLRGFSVDSVQKDTEMMSLRFVEPNFDVLVIFKSEEEL
jgi:hypothetical protein